MTRHEHDDLVQVETGQVAAERTPLTMADLFEIDASAHHDCPYVSMRTDLVARMWETITRLSLKLSEREPEPEDTPEQRSVRGTGMRRPGRMKAKRMGI